MIADNILIYKKKEYLIRNRLVDIGELGIYPEHVFFDSMDIFYFKIRNKQLIFNKLYTDSEKNVPFPDINGVKPKITKQILYPKKYWKIEYTNINMPINYTGTILCCRSVRWQSGEQIATDLVFEDGILVSEQDRSKEMTAKAHLETIKRNIDQAKSLFADGMDVNTRDEYGNTLLHIVALAATTEYIELVKFVVARGADVNARNHQNQTPLDIAKNTMPGNNVVIQYLTDLTHRGTVTC